MILFSLLFPACVSMSIVYRRRERMGVTGSILFDLFKYGEWVLTLNLINLFLIRYVMNIDEAYEELFAKLSFAMKYTVVAVIFAVVLPYVIEIVNKYFSVQLFIGEKNESEE